MKSKATTMKTLIFIILFLFSFVLVNYAQKKYSQENLEKLSQEELDQYLNKSLKLQKAGRTVTISGAVTSGLSIIAILIATGDEETEEEYGPGKKDGLEDLVYLIPLEIGIITMAVGIPMNVTGKKRAKRINTIKGTAFENIMLDLKPSLRHNQVTNNYVPEVTLRITF